MNTDDEFLKAVNLVSSKTIADLQRTPGHESYGAMGVLMYSMLVWLFKIGCIIIIIT